MGTFYMGEASGGVFRTTDYGETWVPITDGQVPLGSSGSIAVADSDPNIIYLGTGSDGARSNVSTGRGVYKTTDGGETWEFAGLYDVGQIGAVRIHPTNPDIVWVAANGDMFKPTSDRGIYKTTDGGRNWRKTLFVSDSTGAMDVEIQPGNPDVVYAEPNYIGTLCYVPSDPLYSQTAADLAIIGMEDAWTIQAGADPSVVVAVIDSGVESLHPDLAGALDLAGSYNFVDGDTNVFDDIGHALVSGLAVHECEQRRGIEHDHSFAASCRRSAINDWTTFSGRSAP